jgi:hypothetical protein
VPTVVGIDHAFAFPIEFFEKYGLPHDWPLFLDDFQRHWPTERTTSTSSSCAMACTATAARGPATASGVD